MKVLGIVGSPRKNGNTDILVDSVLNGVKQNNIQIEKIYLSDYKFDGCIGCEGCSKSTKCVIKDDMQQIYEKLEECDGLVLGSPTYFYNVSWLVKKFIDRLYKYDIFDKENRSVWISPNEIMGMKYAVTVAICEQESIEDLGYTSIVMDKSLQATGYRVVDSIKVLHAFKKGDVNNFENIISSSKKSGDKLGKTLLLSNQVKNKMY